MTLPSHPASSSFLSHLHALLSFAREVRRVAYLQNHSHSLALPLPAPSPRVSVSLEPSRPLATLSRPKERSDLKEMRRMGGKIILEEMKEMRRMEGKRPSRLVEEQ
eukprot:scaffold116903_cov21-Tisochrysis_lutea.AAC.1